MPRKQLIEKTILTAAAIALLALSSPQALGSPVDISEVALYSGGSIDLGNGVSIDGPIMAEGDISVGNNSQLNDVYGGSSVDLGQNTTSATVMEYLSNLATMGNTPQHENIGNQDISGDENSTTTLDSGRYKSLSFAKNVTLNLSAGTYTVEKLDIDEDSVVNIDTSAGDVVLDIVGSFSSKRNVSFQKTGDGNFEINIFDGDFLLERDSELDAVVRVYGGTITTGREVQLAGSIWATGDVNIGALSSFTFRATEVPEPGMLVLVGSGGFFFLLKKHAQKRNRV